MEKKNHLILFGFLMLLSVRAYTNDKSAIYIAYIRNDMQSWKTVMDSIQQQEKKSNETLLSLVNYQYGYIGWCIGMKNKKEATGYISLVRKNLAILEKAGYNLSMVFAYKSALYGYEIGLSNIMAPFIGPKSMKCAEEALKLDPENYFAYMQMGNIQFYMPAMFGGSVNDAIRYFLEAKKQMEKNRNALLRDWNYLHLLTLIAQAYTDAGNFNAAKIYYEAILKIEPRFHWVKNDLYPEILKQCKN
jgi:tetratricopeptide (TPR) repeat protein